MLRDQISDAAENEDEIEPAENKACGGVGWIGLATLGGQDRKRRKKENQEHARRQRKRAYQLATQGFHRASPRPEPDGPRLALRQNGFGNFSCQDAARLIELRAGRFHVRGKRFLCSLQVTVARQRAPRLLQPGAPQERGAGPLPGWQTFRRAPCAARRYTREAFR